MSSKRTSSIAQNIRDKRKQLVGSQDKLFKLASVSYNIVVKIESVEKS